MRHLLGVSMLGLCVAAGCGPSAPSDEDALGTVASASKGGGDDANCLEARMRPATVVRSGDDDEDGAYARLCGTQLSVKGRGAPPRFEAGKWYPLSLISGGLKLVPLAVPTRCETDDGQTLCWLQASLSTTTLPPAFPAPGAGTIVCLADLCGALAPERD